MTEKKEVIEGTFVEADAAQVEDEIFEEEVFENTPQPRKQYSQNWLVVLGIVAIVIFIGVLVVGGRVKASQNNPPEVQVQAPEEIDYDKLADAVVAKMPPQTQQEESLDLEAIGAIVQEKLADVPTMTEIEAVVAEKVAEIQPMVEKAQVVAAPVVEKVQEAAGPVVEQAKETVSEKLNAFMPQTFIVPVGGQVDLSNPLALPEGFPENWEEMTAQAQAAWVVEKIGGPVQPVLGEPNVAFAFNGKGVTINQFTCPTGFVCHGHLVDGDRTVLFRGHQEVAEFYAITVRVEALIPGGGGLCQNWHDALVYETSNQNIVHGLGEVQFCPPLPESRLSEINTALGEKVKELTELTGVDVISIGTVEKGLGAFWVYSSELGTQDIDVPDNYRVLYTLEGSEWTWADGPGVIQGAQGAILFDLDIVSDPEKVASQILDK